jgi:ribonuclease HI
MWPFKRGCERLDIYCDGATGDDGRGAGLGVVVRDRKGEILGLVKRGLPPMTNNEAEYAALVLALEAAHRFKPAGLRVHMDSEVVVGQMQGLFAVHSPALKRWHSQACRLARRYRSVSYVHIPREHNRLADALAAEALAESAASRGRQAREEPQEAGDVHRR